MNDKLFDNQTVNFMKVWRYWVVIGGTERNIGKTTLAEILVKKLSRFGPVIGVKISNIKLDRLGLHGNHKPENSDNFYIWEETRRTGNKDSVRFLKAGAQKSFFIQTKDAYLEEAFQKFQGHISGHEFVVCESNTLRCIMRPVFFFMVRGEDGTSSKMNIEEYLKMADVVVNAMDMKQFEILSNSLVFRSGRLLLRK